MALYLVHVAVDFMSTENINVTKWNELRTSDKWYDGEFPGVYFSLITKDNLRKERLYPGKKVMFFSVKLLEQHNWHLNLKDNNGYVREYNTYFPWNLDEALEKIKSEKIGSSNEVVFHDPVSLKYLCQVVPKPEDYTPGDNFLPNQRMENDEPPDLTKKPFYVYPFEGEYDGVDTGIQKSSKGWFKMMCEVAGISIPKQKDEMIKQLKKRAKYLWTHRDEQDVEILKEYTMGHKSLNKSITHTSL